MGCVGLLLLAFAQSGSTSGAYDDAEEALHELGSGGAFPDKEKFPTQEGDPGIPKPEAGLLHSLNAGNGALPDVSSAPTPDIASPDSVIGADERVRISPALAPIALISIWDSYANWKG